MDNQSRTTAIQFLSSIHSEKTLSTRASIGTGESDFADRSIRIYIDYRELRLSTLRYLLEDIERSYNQIDRHLLGTGSPFSIPRRTPLKVEQINTGNSVVLLFFGSPEVIKLFSLLLTAIHAHWTPLATVGASAYGGAKVLANVTKGIAEFRKTWSEGDKTKAETEKIRGEVFKTSAETEKTHSEIKKIEAEIKKTEAEASKTSLEAVRLRRELNSEEISFPQLPTLIHGAEEIQQPDLLIERLNYRLRILSDSSDIKRVEIDAGGTKLTVEDGTAALTGSKELA